MIGGSLIFANWPIHLLSGRCLGKGRDDAVRPEQRTQALPSVETSRETRPLRVAANRYVLSSQQASFYSATRPLLFTCGA